MSAGSKPGTALRLGLPSEELGSPLNNCGDEVELHSILLVGVGGGPWFCFFLGGVLENGARNVGSASVELPSGFGKALPKSRKLSSFLDAVEGLKKLSWSPPPPKEELLPKIDPPEFSSFLKEKKSSPWEDSGLWSSVPALLKKLAIAFSENEYLASIDMGRTCDLCSKPI